MNKNIIRCICICFKETFKGSALLIVVSLLLSSFPVLGLRIYSSLVSHLSNLASGNELAIPLCLILIYSAFLYLQKLIYNYYNHYYLNYKTLLKFEKNIKMYFYKVCNKLEYEDYLYPENVNETKRAQNASINIFRVFQIVVEIFSAILGVCLIGGLVFSIKKSMIVFLLLAIMSPVADNIYQIIQKRYLLYKNTQNRKEEDEYTNFLTKSELLKEIRILKCFDFIFNKWLLISKSIYNSEKKSRRKTLLVSIIFAIIRLAGTIGAYFSAVQLFVSNEISLAEFSVTILVFAQITQLFNQLFSLFGNLSEFSIMVKPFFDFEKKASSKENRNNLEQKNDEFIHIDDVSYMYPSAGSFALKNISLKIRKGDFVSIVGDNGSGKTTLSKILLGFLSPTSGCIRVNGGNAVTNNTSYIPQLFNCYCVSIRDNILFGNFLDLDILDDYLQSIGLYEFVDKKNESYGLEFGGIELSGGQKQKLAILRAICKEADILMFDEPTSAIDPVQESLIYRKLLEISQGKTTIMVSHRLALTKRSDLIVVLHDGEIHEMGDHQSLLSRNGIYKEMWDAQSGLYIT
mgnify:CR=1 FL=1